MAKAKRSSRHNVRLRERLGSSARTVVGQIWIASLLNSARSVRIWRKQSLVTVKPHQVEAKVPLIEGRKAWPT